MFEGIEIHGRPEPKLIVDEPTTKIWRANCLDAPKLIERSTVSLIITSPPYPGVPQPEGDYVTYPDPMDFNGFHDLLHDVWETCFILLEDLGRLCVNIYDIPTGASGMYPNVARVIKDCLNIGFVLREQYIWHKEASYSPPSGSWPYPKGVLSANTYEPILVFQKPLEFQQRRKDPSDYPKEIRDASELGKEEHDWLMDPVWRITADREGRKLGHPFTYPTELVRRLIRLYSFAGDIIFDPFLGSGTTVQVARDQGRLGYGTELSDKYVDICEKRFGQASLF